MTRKNKVDDLLTRFERKSAKQNQKCPYCHNEIGRVHYALLDSNFLTSDEYMEATVDINSNDKTMVLTIGDYYGDNTDEIKINYCPICGRKL
ncbi:hypothetical protein [Lactobacillus johnsonii]|uniref:hypothetical protein n=1 Tax=Lactobacillus johnsonii TaxID=33959 RepID=UPI003098283F